MKLADKFEDWYKKTRSEYPMLIALTNKEILYVAWAEGVIALADEIGIKLDDALNPPPTEQHDN